MLLVMGPFKTPILYMVFNRIETVKRTFPLIAAQKPKKLFISADGPRTKEEEKKTDAVRKFILDNINWKCEVKTRFLDGDHHLGCLKACNASIDWFFKNVKKGIILEDDCMPNKSFFRFSEEMLDRYENNPKIFSISGYNYLKKFNVKESYYFSKYFYCWGWSTWRDRWFAQDKEMNDYLEDLKTGKFDKMMKSPIERYWAKKGFGDRLQGKVGAWDDSFSYLHLKNNGLCIKPKVNLVKNIGFMKDSTHTSGNFVDNTFYCFESYELKFPLVHPKEIKLNLKDAKKFMNKTMLRVFLKKIFFLK